MRTSLLILSLVIVSTSSAAIVPMTASPTLKKLLQTHGSVVAGPFTIDDFSLKMETANGTWRTASAAVAATLSVRPITATPAGIEIFGTASPGSVLSSLTGLELSYRLTTSESLTSAIVSLQAAAAGGNASFDNRLSVAPAAFSNPASQADTHWSSASPTVGLGLSAQLAFTLSTALDVSDTATIHPGNAAVVAFAVDNVFVPEPCAVFVIAPFWLFRRRRLRL